MKTPALTIIGLCGRSGVGKDTLADWVLAKHGFFKMPLTAHFKVESVGQGRFTFDEVFETKPPQVRTYLQSTGSWGRERDADVWLRHAWAWMDFAGRFWGLTRFVITDVRFPNEVRWCQERGARVIGIHSDRGDTLTAEQRAHPTEKAVDEALKLCDGQVWNDRGMPWPSIEAQVLERLRELSVL